MTQKQMYEQCILFAPNFRIGLEFPVLGRSLVWRGTPRTSLVELTAGVLYPADAQAEPLWTFLLNQALVTLGQAV